MIDKLENAIKRHNIEQVKELLEKGTNPNGNFGNSFLKIAEKELLNGGSIKVLELLLQYGASLEFSSIEEMDDDILSSAIHPNSSIKVIKLFLEYGANPGFVNTNGRESLDSAIFANRLDVASLLLEYGAISIMNERHAFTLFSMLDQAVIYSGADMIMLLLDNGADTCVQGEIDNVLAEADDFFEDVWIDGDDSTKVVYSIEESRMLNLLLKQNNSPYLNLDDDRYIIYENETIDDRINSYLLADKEKYKDKKYLYADNKIDTFIYWCYKKDLLIELTNKVIENYLSKIDEINYKTIGTMLKQTLGEKVTTELFDESGKEFARAYLTVTHWWYNLHTDFNRLFNDQDKKPKAIENQEEFDTMLKLLDIRYEQFKSGEDFNSNQNREELEALVEGREPPKRVVDLSFLEDEGKEEEQEAKFIPLIQLKSRELAPKTGRYQATLPKEHPRAEFLKNSGFDTKQVKEGETIGTFGLSGGDEELIVWVYLGE